jgi:ADP-ribose pyrophosphatase YjhB (NUDIX family)
MTIVSLHMENLIPEIHNAARALVIRNGSILLLRKNTDAHGECFALPGGTQETGETLEQALNRECMEEIGSEVRILDLLHVADWFKRRETEPPTTRQMVEFLFHCEVPDGYRACNGHKPDKHQVDVVWKGLHELAQIRLFPRTLVGYLADYPRTGLGVYLGTLD